jgi:hypothetical protein
MTRRAQAEACRHVGEQNRSVAYVARDLGVGWATVMSSVVEHGQPLVDDADRTAAVSSLGLDEVAFGSAKAHGHTTFAGPANEVFADLSAGFSRDGI